MYDCMLLYNKYVNITREEHYMSKRELGNTPFDTHETLENVRDLSAGIGQKAVVATEHVQEVDTVINFDVPVDPRGPHIVHAGPRPTGAEGYISGKDDWDM